MANHIRNRCVTSSLQHGTPYEAWFGRRPDISHLQIFGSKVYILDKTPRRGKFDPNGIQRTFVGYSENLKAFRVWIPSEKKV